MATYIVETPYFKREYSRRDAAANAFIKEVRVALSAGGQLDTMAGKLCYAPCEQMAKDVASGAYSLFSFSQPLPHNAGFIKFERNN